MPTSSVGKTTKLPLAHARGSARAVATAGVTLIEMLVVVALISLMVGISYPAITSGIDSLRLRAASNSVVSFINAGLSRAARRQQVVEITIYKQENSLEMQSAEPGFVRKMQLPEGITITHLLPELPDDVSTSRTYLLYPGGTAPPLGVQMMNRRNVERVVRVDPITGVPRVEAPPQP